MGEIKKLLAEMMRNEYETILNDMHRLDEYARIGFMDKYEVVVFTDDGGHIPHVHVRDRATRGKEFDTCVKLESNEYFIHGPHQDRFNTRGRKEFNEFMSGKCASPKYINNYEYAADMWNMNNSTTNVEIRYDENGNIIMPDYTTIMG